MYNKRYRIFFHVTIDVAPIVIHKIFQSNHERESPKSVGSLSLNCVPEDG